MDKVGKFYHYPYTVPQTTVTLSTSYDVNNKVNITMDGTQDRDFPWRGYLESLLFGVSNIAGGCSKITCRICVDDQGQYSSVGDFEVPIDFGITDPTAGTCQAILGIAYKNILAGLGIGGASAAHANEIHVFFKCDAGSCDVDVAQCIWSE